MLVIFHSQVRRSSGPYLSNRPSEAPRGDHAQPAWQSVRAGAEPADPRRPPGVHCVLLPGAHDLLPWQEPQWWAGRHEGDVPQTDWLSHHTASRGKSGLFGWGKWAWFGPYGETRQWWAGKNCCCTMLWLIYYLHLRSVAVCSVDQQNKNCLVVFNIKLSDLICNL